MSLHPNSMQYLNQLGLMTFVDIDDKGYGSAYKLVPCAHWHNGQKFPHSVIKDLVAHTFKQSKIEGLDYYLVPDDTINSKGKVSRYGEVAQENLDYAAQPSTKAPPAVNKYLKSEKKKIKRIGPE